MMGRFFCDNDREHEDKARRDARYNHKDYDEYDRYTNDPCKEIYTETYDRERHRIELRQEEEREEQRQNENRHAEHIRENQWLEDQWAQEQQQADFERLYYEQAEQEEIDPNPQPSPSLP